MNAAPADQLRLLDIADADVRIRQAEHDRTHPSQGARVQELLAQRQSQSQELAARLGQRDELRTELARIESDVAVVDARAARDAERLQVVTNPKDAQGLEHEIASLAKRKSDLEDAELDIMERLEDAERAVTEQESLIAGTNAEGARLSAEGRAAVADATERLETASAERTEIAASIPSDLLGLYERLATRSAGAALLLRRTCEGCHMVLAGTDLQAIRHAEHDVVVTCPECGCILVRTEESGL